jgi:hypothetical protein
LEEQIFFDSKDIKITNTRFVALNQTYAMSSVNSVKVTKNDITASIKMPIIIGIIGLIFLFNNLSNSLSNYAGYVFPILMLTWATFWFKSVKTQYEFIIVLRTSSGEMSALKSTDEMHIKSVEDALIQAIVHRG